jgi:hypothetical protein
MLGNPASLSEMTLRGFRAMRPAIAVASQARTVAALAAVAAAGLAGCTAPASPPASHAAGAASTPARQPPSPSPSTPSRLASAFRLLPARGPGHLAPGSDPAALPGDVLIADEDNRAAIGGPTPSRVVRAWLIAQTVPQAGHAAGEFGRIELADRHRTLHVL